VLFNVRAVVQRNGWRGLQPAAAIAAAVYWIHASLAGGSDLGLAEGFVSVWGLSLAFACTVGQPVATPQLVLPPLLTRAHTRFSAAWSDLVGSLHDPAKAPTRRRVGAVVGGFAILLVGALVIATRPKSAPPLTPAQRLLDVRFYKALQAPVLSSVPPAAALSLISWDFSHNGNAGWTPVAGAESRQYPGYLSVQTAPAAQSYQFTSGVSTLPPSHYELLLRGRLIAGGMSLGALDVSSNHWTSTASYWYGQSQGHVIDMAVTFTLRATTPLQFILSNLAPRPMRSAWRLTSASLLRIATPHKTSAHATSP
jgi:hypothetical protein